MREENPTGLVEGLRDEYTLNARPILEMGESSHWMVKWCTEDPSHMLKIPY